MSSSIIETCLSPVAGSLFIETLRIDGGHACNLAYHNRRMNDTRRHLSGECGPILLEEHLHLSPDMDGVKCRVLYDVTGIREITYVPYVMRPVHTLQLIREDGIDYTYKSADREALNRLFALRGNQDDVLIVRKGLLTDTSVANIALFDGREWYTPSSPLLRGTRREALLDQGLIREQEIPMEELTSFSHIRLFNALIGWGVLELPVTHVVK